MKPVHSRVVVTRTLLGTSASLLVTSALLVVTMFAIRNKCIASTRGALVLLKERPGFADGAHR